MPLRPSHSTTSLSAADRLSLAAAIVGLTLTFGASAAQAATSVDLIAGPSASVLTINDGTNDDDAIVVSVAANTITISDAGLGGVTTADVECTEVNPTTVTCPLDPPDPAPPAPASAPVSVVLLGMNDGTDSFTNQNLLAEVIESDETATGSKTINSGPGRDSIITGTGNDIVNLGDGNDDVETGAGNDTVTGGAGEDDIDAGEGSDIVEAGAGTDDVDEERSYSEGADILDGGPGMEDEIDYQGANPVTIAINGIADDGHPGEGDNLIGFEELNGTEGADTITGSAADDDIGAAGGNDAINGGAGDDEIQPGEGDDLADGGEGGDDFEGDSEGDSGADTLVGGPGSGDFVDYGGVEPIAFTPNGVADDGRAGEGDNVSGIEGAGGSEGADRLEGDGSSNQFFGGGGDDLIVGRGGNDALSGGDGDDTLLARGGRDDIDCGLGFDTPIHDAEDIVAGGCERRGAEVFSNNVRATKKGKAKVRISCPAEEGARCRGRVILLSNGRQIGKGRFNVDNGKAERASVRVTKRGLRMLARSRRSLRVTAEARTIEPQGVSVNAARLELETRTRQKRRRGA